MLLARRKLKDEIRHFSEPKLVRRLVETVTIAPGEREDGQRAVGSAIDRQRGAATLVVVVYAWEVEQ